MAAASLGLGGCGRTIPLVGQFFDESFPQRSHGGRTLSRPDYRMVYASYPGEQFPIPAFDHTSVHPTFLRQEVAYDGPEVPGTIIVEPASYHLFFVEPGRRATRYGVGVGREGFGWSGAAQVNMRRAWPDWIPPREMVAREGWIQAQLEMTPRGLGVPGGPRSPLGARALYLFSQQGDTGYRIHGTTEPETIGTDVSSGCIRMVNQDIVHIYSRAPAGTKVIVLA